MVTCLLNFAKWVHLPLSLNRLTAISDLTLVCFIFYNGLVYN